MGNPHIIFFVKDCFKYDLKIIFKSHLKRTDKDDFKGMKNRIHPELLLGWDLPLQKLQNESTFLLKPQAALILAPNRGSDEDIPNEDSNSFEFGETHLFNSSLYPGADKIEKSNQRIDYGVNFSVKSEKNKHLKHKKK